MYAAIRTKEVLTNSTEVYLEKEVNAMRKKNPAITDDEVYRRLIKKSTKNSNGLKALLRSSGLRSPN